MSADLSRLAASIKVPTLAMGGGAKPKSLHLAVQAVASAIPGAQLRMLEGRLTK